MNILTRCLVCVVCTLLAFIIPTAIAYAGGGDNPPVPVESDIAQTIPTDAPVIDVLPDLTQEEIATAVQNFLAVVYTAFLTVAAALFGKFAASPAGAVLISLITKFAPKIDTALAGAISGMILFILFAAALHFGVRPQLDSLLQIVVNIVPLIAAFLSTLNNQPQAYQRLSAGVNALRVQGAANAASK
jgi:hypothetical protein